MLHELWTTDLTGNWTAWVSGLKKTWFNDNFVSLVTTTTTVFHMKTKIASWNYAAYYDNTYFYFSEDKNHAEDTDGFGIRFPHRTSDVPDTDHCYVQCYSKEAGSWSGGDLIGIPNAYIDDKIIDFTLTHSGTAITLTISTGTTVIGTNTITTNIFTREDANWWMIGGTDQDSAAFTYEKTYSDTVSLCNGSGHGDSETAIYEWSIGNQLSASTVDTFTMSDTLTSLGLTFTDTFTMSDTLTSLGLNFTDTFTISDSIVTSFIPVPYLFTSSTWRYAFPVDWARPNNSISKDVSLYDFWDSTRQTTDTGINSQPLQIGGTITIGTGKTFISSDALAEEIERLNTDMNNGEEFTISTFGDCINGVYIIKDFHLKTIKGTPYAFDWDMTLELVRDE